MDEELADALKRAEKLNLWVTSVRNYTTKALIQSRRLPGFKLVSGRFTRRFSDPEAAGSCFRALIVCLYKSYVYSFSLLFHIDPFRLHLRHGVIPGKQIRIGFVAVMLSVYRHFIIFEYRR